MAKETDNIALLDSLINNMNAEDAAKNSARRVAVEFEQGTNKRTYMIDPTYAAMLGPSFDVFWNMSKMTVFCDGIERPITNEHYQSLQTYLQFQREQIRARSVKSNFDGRTEVGDFRRIK
jgi:hypothetical protein